MYSENLPAGGRSRSSREHNPDLLRDADLLVRQHGADADLVAARLADCSFRSGDEATGFRWLKVFRIIADSNLRGIDGGA
jgi:hypothetical protein